MLVSFDIFIYISGERAFKINICIIFVVYFCGLAVWTGPPYLYFNWRKGLGGGGRGGGGDINSALAAITCQLTRDMNFTTIHTVRKSQQCCSKLGEETQTSYSTIQAYTRRNLNPKIDENRPSSQLSRVLVSANQPKKIQYSDKKRCKWTREKKIYWTDEINLLLINWKKNNWWTTLPAWKSMNGLTTVHQKQAWTH